MTEKRFKLKYINEQHISANLYDDNTFIASIGMGEELIAELLNQLNDENEQLKYENENLKITINARDTLIEVCEKKFRELGFIITVDDDGYVIE